MPDVKPLRNVKFRVPLTFTAAKVFVNIFSRKYYFSNNLEITLARAKFWTLCCVSNRVPNDSGLVFLEGDSNISLGTGARRAFRRSVSFAGGAGFNGTSRGKGNGDVQIAQGARTGEVLRGLRISVSGEASPLLTFNKRC